jgi:hypothetical protein
MAGAARRRIARLDPAVLRPQECAAGCAAGCRRQDSRSRELVAGWRNRLPTRTALPGALV